MPFFSVIIPTFNRASFLIKALDSVNIQTFDDYELIVVDDGSTDNTEEICSKYNLKYLKTENLGVSHARNLGAKESRGKWLAFLDSDDIWLKDKLSLQYEFIQNNPDIYLVHTNERWFRNGVHLNQHKKHKKSGGRQFIPSLKMCAISPSSVVISKELFDENNGFREDYPCCEDYDLWLKITARNNIGFIDKVLLHKNGGHEDQLSFQFKAMDFWRVKSIDSILSSSNLSDEDRSFAISILIKKCKILLNGYKKYDNFENYEEISKLYIKYF